MARLSAPGFFLTNCLVWSGRGGDTELGGDLSELQPVRVFCEVFEDLALRGREAQGLRAAPGLGFQGQAQAGQATRDAPR
jgi:hypothetical protein